MSEFEQEVEAIAKAVFEIESNGRWENTTEAMRDLYRVSIRNALRSVRAMAVLRSVEEGTE